MSELTRKQQPKKANSWKHEPENLFEPKSKADESAKSKGELKQKKMIRTNRKKNIGKLVKIKMKNKIEYLVC